MNPYWNTRTCSLDPYVPGEQPQDRSYIKLNTNENPFPPSPKAVEAMQAAVGDDLRLYPDPDGADLKQAIAEVVGVEVSNVFVGNGSDEVLAHTFAGLLDESKPVVFPDISYSFYPVYAGLYGLEAQTVPLNDQFEISLDNYPLDNGGIIFPNPNAPTGVVLPLSEIEALLRRNTQTVVVVDEAYIDFGGESAVSLVDQYPNLLVVFTFSKSRSLAGMRIGYAIGDAGLIEGLERVKNSFNSYPLSRVALAGAEAAMRDIRWFNEKRNQIISVRETTLTELKRLNFEVLPSAANFVFARPKQMGAEALYLALKDNGVLVRYFNKPRISDFLRITVGTEGEMQVLIQAIEAIFAEL